MKRLALATFALVALAASAGAQVIPPGTNPVPSGGAYNFSPPTCVSGSACWLQVDVNGNLKTTATFSPSGTQDINLKQYNGVTAPTNGLPVQQVGTAAIATGQASVTTGNISIVAARTGVVGTGRKSVCVTNVTGTGPVYIGVTGLTTANGQYLAGAAGASICLDTQAAIFGTVTSVTQTVSYVETF